jgi:hypothetical protein
MEETFANYYQEIAKGIESALLDPAKKQQIFPEFAQYEMKLKLLTESEFLHINPPTEVAKKLAKDLNDLFSKELVNIFTDSFLHSKKLHTLRPISKDLFAKMYLTEFDLLIKDLVSGIFAKYPQSVKNIKEFWPVSFYLQSIK